MWSTTIEMDYLSHSLITIKELLLNCNSLCEDMSRLFGILWSFVYIETPIYTCTVYSKLKLGSKTNYILTTFKTT